MEKIKDSWSFKYAPQRLEDVILSETSKNKLLNMTQITNNLLFIGPSGIGKSTVAGILTKKFAPHSYLYLNGSEENSIDIVRNKIMDFVEKRSIDNSIKIVRIEEFDGFSLAAQQALREIIESNLDDTRFILTGNESHKIRDAIKSRCVTIEMNPDILSIKRLIVSILKKEGIAITDDNKAGIGTIIKRFFPDIRKILNELQACCQTGSFVLSVKESGIADNIIDMLNKKTNVFDIRQYVIDNVDEFASDYHRLMRDMFNSYIKEKNVKAVQVIPEYMYRSAFVADQEVNFCALIYELSVK